jgi:hypothetical protein
MLMEFTYPSGTRKNVARTIEHDTQRISPRSNRNGCPHNRRSRFTVLRHTRNRTATIEGAAPCNETWHLDNDQGALIKEGVEISLTGLETALVRKMLHHEERVVSRDDLILSIGREPEQYRGLEMCLSRLQDKFKTPVTANDCSCRKKSRLLPDPGNRCVNALTAANKTNRKQCDYKNNKSTLFGSPPWLISSLPPPLLQ